MSCLRRTLVVTQVLAAGLVVQAARGAEFVEVTDFGSNPGNLQMFEYVPDQATQPAPLVVVLHGCGQTAQQYARDAGWIRLADRGKFVLLAPEEPNPTTLDPRCFNWFITWDNQREQGQAGSIRQMIDRVKARHAIDNRRVFVTGLSAGGAMAAVLLAAYPETFAGGAIIAGLPYRSADTVGPWYAMNVGLDLRPEQWAQVVRAQTDYAGPWPRVSIWHSPEDQRVVFKNATELIEQWTSVHGVDSEPAVVDEVKSYPHKLYKDRQGRTVVEVYELNGLAHGTPVQPGDGTDQGGVRGRFVYPSNIFSSYYIARFWGLNGASK
jgi:poly(hydroxyalkanoate) depolymerase family esterase